MVDQPIEQPEEPDNSSPTVLRRLTPQQQLQLTEILDSYLAQLEDHQQPSREQLLQNHPDLATALSLYLEKLDELYRATERVPGASGDLAGKLLGDYRLEREIGRGGMGIVFAAHDQRLNRQVAVKLLPMAALLDEKYVERFKNEARAAAHLEHPNIVPVYSIGEEGGIHYFAMRLIDGQSLDQRVAEHRAQGTKPPTAAAVRKFASIAEALHKAHEVGIVHRDIKPSNLLLDKQGELWIADFGLARFQADGAITRTGEMIGTMRYMSPEQAAGKSELVDHRTDVYSLGATLYELLTLQPAVEGEEGPGLLQKIGARQPLRLCRLRPDCPRDLQTVVAKAMAFAKEDRYATAQELAEDLLCVSQGLPTRARPISPTVRLTRWAVKHGLAFAVAASILLMAAIGLVTSNLLIAHERNLALRHAAHARASMDELAQVADELALVPGAEKIRQQVLQRTLNYYQSFSQQALGDSTLKADTAAACTRVGSLLEELGSPTAAVNQYQIAEAIYSTLLAESPSNVHYRMQRNENLNHLGLALSATGQAIPAVETLAGAVERQRDAARPTAPAEQTHLALSLNNYGLALHKANRRVAARNAFTESIQLLESAREDAANDHEIARGLAAAYQNFGTLIASEDPSLALQQLNQALSIQLWLSEQSVNRLRISRDLVSTYLNLGNVQLQRQAMPEAVQSFENAAQIGRQLVAISPQVDSYRRDLAISLSNLGMSQYQQGDATDALGALQESEQQYRRLLELYPGSAGLRSSLGIALNNQAIVLQHLGKNRDAGSVYSEAATVLEAARLDEPTSEHISALEKVYINHVRMLYAAGKEAEAARLVERQLALAETHRPGTFTNRDRD